MSTDSRAHTLDKRIIRLLLPVLGLAMLGMALNTGGLMLLGTKAEAVVTSVKESRRRTKGNMQRREFTANYTFSLPNGTKVSGSSSNGVSTLKKGEKVNIRYLSYYPWINDIASIPFNILSFLFYSVFGVSLLGSALLAKMWRNRHKSING